MEKDIQLGSVGSLDLVLASGKATLTLVSGYAPAGVSANVGVTLDSATLLDLLFAAIEKASPAGIVAIEEGAKGILKDAVAKIA